MIHHRHGDGPTREQKTLKTSKFDNKLPVVAIKLQEHRILHLSMSLAANKLQVRVAAASVELGHSKVIYDLVDEEYHVLFFVVHPFDSGYGSNSRTRYVFVMLLRGRTRLIGDVAGIYRRLSEELSKVPPQTERSLFIYCYRYIDLSTYCFQHAQSTWWPESQVLSPCYYCFKMVLRTSAHDIYFGRCSWSHRARGST